MSPVKLPRRIDSRDWKIHEKKVDEQSSSIYSSWSPYSPNKNGEDGFLDFIIKAAKAEKKNKTSLSK
jgi:hypothetical protein